MSTRETVKTVLTNALLDIPGTRDWIGHDRVAEVLLQSIENAGGEIIFPKGEPLNLKRDTKAAASMRHLVEMDRADRPFNRMDRADRPFNR